MVHVPNGLNRLPPAARFTCTSIVFFTDPAAVVPNCCSVSLDSKYSSHRRWSHQARRDLLSRDAGIGGFSWEEIVDNIIDVTHSPSVRLFGTSGIPID